MSSISKNKHRIGLVIAFALCAAFLFTLIGVLTKVALRTVPNTMVVFFRQAFGFVLLLPVVVRDFMAGRSLKTDRFHLHILRTVAALGAMYSMVYALKYLPVVDAVVLGYTRPLFVPFVIWLWMGRRLASQVWLGLLIGFVGVVCIVKPTETIFEWAALAALASGLFGALAFTVTRKLAKRESATTIAFYITGLSLPATALPLYWSWAWPPLEGWLYLALIGLLATIYQILLGLAYKYGHTSKVASFLYSAVVFALILDWVIWGQIADFVSLVGIVLISIGCLVVVRDKKAGG